VYVYNSMPRVVDRSQWGAGSTYESANKVGSHPADAVLSRRNAAGEPGRSAAMSALRNEGFGSMAKVSDPRASETMMQIQRSNVASGSADYASVLAAYSEHS